MMTKRIPLLLSLPIILSMLSACGPQVSVEDQVQTAIAETAIVQSAEQTSVAEGIAATFAAIPTNTPTSTDVPTSTYTPTSTLTETTTPTLTQTAVPLPPIVIFYQTTHICSGKTLLVFSISNFSNETFYSYTIRIRHNESVWDTGSMRGFPRITNCNWGMDYYSIPPGGSGNAHYLFYSTDLIGQNLEASIAVFTDYEFRGKSYTSGLYFTP
jgi:hypothetical protein